VGSLDRWIDLDGTDLLLIGPASGPLELTASHAWITPTVGAVSRPFLPARLQPTVARLYPDGPLALSWPASRDVDEGAGIDRPLPDLVVIDLAACPPGDALELYDIAYDAMYPSTSALPPSGDI
jgi:hypothetical protein